MSLDHHNYIIRKDYGHSQQGWDFDGGSNGV